MVCPRHRHQGRDDEDRGRHDHRDPLRRPGNAPERFRHSEPALLQLQRDVRPAAAYEHTEREGAVRRALSALPREQREVLLLKEYEGLKFREIADVLGVAESTVKSRMYAGLDAMRMSLASLGIQ